MTYSVLQIANIFIDKAINGKIDNLTPMKLQKLMFFAQSWYLRQTGDLLFDDAFARWKYGPVLPVVFQIFKSFGSNKITQKAKDVNGLEFAINSSDADDILNFIDEIINEYGSFTGPELSSMTQQQGTAWDLHKNNFYIAPTDLMRGRL